MLVLTVLVSTILVWDSISMEQGKAEVTETVERSEEIIEEPSDSTDVK